MAKEKFSSEIQAIIAKYSVLKKAFETGVESHDGREEALLSFIKSHPNREELRNNPQGILLDAMDDFSAKHEFLISIGGQKSGVIRDLLTKEGWKEKGKMVVELGGYLAYSAILFADALCSAGQGGGVQIFSLERSEQFATIAREFIELAGFSDLITVVVGPAASSLRTLVSSGELEKMYFLFLDHAEELYLDDFKVCNGWSCLGGGVLWLRIMW